MECLENRPFSLKVREFSIIFMQVMESKLFSSHIVLINSFHGFSQSGYSICFW